MGSIALCFAVGLLCFALSVATSPCTVWSPPATSPLREPSVCSTTRAVTSPQFFVTLNASRLIDTTRGNPSNRVVDDIRLLLDSLMCGSASTTATLSSVYRGAEFDAAEYAVAATCAASSCESAVAVMNFVRCLLEHAVSGGVGLAPLDSQSAEVFLEIQDIVASLDVVRVSSRLHRGDYATTMQPSVQPTRGPQRTPPPLPPTSAPTTTCVARLPAPPSCAFTLSGDVISLVRGAFRGPLVAMVRATVERIGSLTQLENEARKYFCGSGFEVTARALTQTSVIVSAPCLTEDDRDGRVVDAVVRCGRAIEMMNAFRCALLVSDVSEIEGADDVPGFNGVLAQLAANRSSEGFGISTVSQVTITVAPSDPPETAPPVTPAPTAACEAPPQALLTSPGCDTTSTMFFVVSNRHQDGDALLLQRAVEGLACDQTSVAVGVTAERLPTGGAFLTVRVTCAAITACDTERVAQLTAAVKCLMSLVLSRSSTLGELPPSVSASVAAMREIIAEMGITSVSNAPPEDEPITEAPSNSGGGAGSGGGDEEEDSVKSEHWIAAAIGAAVAASVAGGVLLWRRQHQHRRAPAGPDTADDHHRNPIRSVQAFGVGSLPHELDEMRMPRVPVAAWGVDDGPATFSDPVKAPLVVIGVPVPPQDNALVRPQSDIHDDIAQRF